jgi:hypothetical protein
MYNRKFVVGNILFQTTSLNHTATQRYAWHDFKYYIMKINKNCSK